MTLAKSQEQKNYQIMKNIYYSLLFFGMGLFASAQDMGGTPVEGLIPIKRTGIITQTATDAKATNSVARTAAVQDYISAPTGTSEEVGITEGQLSVSLSGAATYSIPIAVPPGINGVVPQVSLVYNSQGGNGLAGYGWNISGVSAITRIPRTQFHDGVVGGVNLDANDRFALDGQRLILKTGTIYGAAGAVYETENFSNLKITSQGTSSSDPNPSFKVEYPDGSVAMYGATTNSRSITTWGISYWENPQGVRISYNYLLANLANNNLTIEFIKYGTVGIITPINEIQFVYETRQRSEEYYMGGQRILMDKILSEIKVLGNNGVGFRNYVLGHNVTSLSHYQRLTSITEKTGNNTLALNPTVFAYEDNANTIKYTNITTDLELDGESFIDFNNGGKFVSGDFDGDEKMDFLIPFSVPEGWYNGYNLYTNITNGYSSNIGLKHNIGNYNEIFAVSLLNSKNELMSKQGWAVVSPIDEISYHNVDNPGYIFDVYAMQKPNNDPNSESQVYHQYNREVHFPLTTEAVIIYDRGLLVDTKHVEINKEIFSGDFNGDGFTDVIAIEINYSNSGSYSYGESDYRSVYFVDLKRNNTTNVLTYCGKLLKNISTHHHKIEIADVNGDGKMDIMYFEHQNLTVYTLDKNNQLEVLLNYKDDDIFLLERLCETTLGGFPYCFWAFSHPNLRDYNGDGKMDFGTIKGSFLSTGISYIHEPIKTISVSSDSASSELDRIEYNGFPTPIKIDFNNDGKQDVLIIYYKSQNQFNPDYGVTFRLLINDNGSLNKGNTYTSPYFPNVSGMPIFLSTKDPGKKLEIALLSGNKIHHFESLFDFSQEKLLRSITTGNGVRESISYLPLTKNAVLPDAVDPSDAQSGSVYTPLYSPDKYPLQNIESEETVDVVAKIEKQSSSVHKKQMYSYFGATSNMEGLGFLGFRAVMQTNWVSATDQWADYENTMMSSVSVASPYLRGANVANYSFKGFYPVSRIKFLAEANPPIDKEVSVNNSRTAEETLRASKRIRLLPGARIAPTTGNVFVAQIEPDANTSQTMVTDYITKSTAAYDSSLSDTKVYKLKNTQSNTYNALDNTSSETKITSYDDYNNPLESTSKIMNAGIEEQSTTTTIVYKDPILTATTTTPYLIGLPESKTQTVTTAIDTTTSDEVYEYTKNLLTKAKKKANNSDYIIEDNEYDIYGNITRKTITAPAVGLNPAPAARVTNYEYNPASPYNGRFLTKSTDIQGLETQYNYNPSSGVLDSITNPYNLTTSYLYDSWFKKTQTTDYLGKKNTYTYTRNGSISTIAATGDDGSYSFEVYDDLGRKTQTTVKDISGNNSTISYEYDIYDRQVKVFEPNNLNQWSETKYDQYGRIEESKSHTGKTVTMTYSGLTTTVVDESKTKTYTKNALGNVVSMTDTPGGIINYTYFANGNLKTTNYDGIETIIEQDDWGRKTYLNDPSAGEYRYAYNGFGETTSETTPNGTTTYNLDDFGRLSTKTIIGNKTNSQTTYNYDSTLKLLNSSVFEDLQAGTATTYTYLYDDSKRLYKTTEDTPNLAKFTKELKFDLFGRVDKETSIASLNGKSSSKTIKNTYKNGYPWQILTDETTPKVLWQTNTVNARGQLLTAQLGNGIAITNAYDDYGYSTQIKHDKTGTNPSNVMTLNTTFDPVKGNLKTRTNNMFGQWSEDFTNSYDSQDRLTSYKNALGATEYQRYDDKGKITENSIGFYNYTQTAYQNSSVTLKLGVKTYYDTNAKRQQTIDYNTFKSPYEITAGNEKLSFT